MDFGTAFNEYSELYASTGDMLFLGTFEEPREFIQKAASVTNAYVENTWVQPIS
jgi:ribosomal protein S2